MNHTCSQTTNITVSVIKSTDRRKRSVSSTRRNKDSVSTSTCIHGRCELDSHADTTVAGSNCVILHYTGKECDVSPYTDDYESINNVPIVHAATAWQSPETGQTYILVFNEALWMGKTMDHSLINPNQLRHYGTTVNDNPMSKQPLSIITDGAEFSMELSMAGTIVFAETHSPSPNELETCPHITLSSPHPWNPHNISFPSCRRTLEEEIGGIRQLSSLSTNQGITVDDIDNDDPLFNLNRITRCIASMKVITSPRDNQLRRPNIDSGTSDVPVPSAFSSSERHSDVTPQALSERWGISIAMATKTLQKTTQKFLRSAVLPLSRRYRADRVFTRKTLAGDWSTDTMDARCKSLEGNKYAQVFANKGYFSRIYPMNSKKKAGDALRLFCQEFGVPERLTFDGSKEQKEPSTEFMKQIRTHNIDYHISEPDLHNQNPVEGVIRELRRKWYRIMIKNQVP